jgi:hypothetical protein
MAGFTANTPDPVAIKKAEAQIAKETLIYSSPVTDLGTIC